MAVHLNILSRFQDKGLTDAQKQLKKFSSGLKGIAGALGVGLGLSAVISGLREVGMAASEDIKSQALLATQLRNTTGANDEQIASIEKVIQAMQMQVGIADDELRPAYAGLVRATGDTTQAQRLLALSADIAAGTGKDLATVSAAVGKAAAGQTTALYRLVPALKGSADWASAAEKQFAGMAKTAAQNDPFKMLSIIFEDIQEQIGTKLIPYLQDFVAYLNTPAGQAQLTALVEGFTKLIVALGQAATWVFENTQLIGNLTIGLGAATIAYGFLSAAITLMTAETITATVAMQAFKVALASTGIGLVLVALGAIASAFMAAGDAANNAAKANQNYNGSLPGGTQIVSTPTTDVVRPLNPKPGQVFTFFRYDKGQAVWYTQTWDGKKWSEPKKMTYTKPGGTSPSDTKADPVKTFTANLFDEIRKAQARTKLAAMGASEGLIASIIGSGDQWRKVYDNIVAGGQAAIDTMQARFNRTQAGLDALAEKQAKIEEARREAIDAANQKLEDFIAKQEDATQAIKDSLIAVRALGKIEKDLGEFEQASVDAFNGVAQSIEDAFANGSILKSSYDALKSYAASEGAVLAAIGRQRDELATKKSLVESLMSDIKSAITGAADINKFVTQQTETITEATTRIVNGLSVTSTRTFEVLKSQNTIVSGFQDVLNKARSFVANLKQLRALGLSTDLFKQIVDAGVESGGATAAALISGGAATIAEVNSLYKDIQTEAGNAAEETAQYMYGTGLDVTKGIMAGIAAQETALVSLADSLGTKFADAFSAQVKAAMDAALLSAQFARAQATAFQFRPDYQTKPFMAPEIFTGPNASGFRAASVGVGEQVPVQINLNMDARVVAQSLVKLEKTSGSIWVRATV